MKKLHLIALTVITFVCSSQLFSQGHKIDIEINGAENEEMILIHYYGNKYYPDDTLQFNAKGKATIQGDTLLPEGLYLLYWPKKSNIELLIGKDQEFSIKTDTSDIYQNMDIKGCKAFEELREIHRISNKLGRINMDIQEKMKQSDLDKDSVEILQELIDANTKKVLNSWNDAAEKFPGSMLEVLSNLMKNTETKEFNIPEDIINKDSMQWILNYRYRKERFFDHVAFDDPRILRTPIFHRNKLDHFFKKMLPQNPDTLVVYAHKIMERTNGNTEMINYLSRYFINYYQESDRIGMDKLFVEISERYILTKQANWMNEETFKKIRDEVAKNKYNLIGLLAIDLEMENQEGEYQRLYDKKSKVTLVYFWDTDCGHCKKATPKVYEIYNKYDRSEFDVYAVYVEQDKEKWKDYINENKYEWTNVYDPQNISNFRFFYNIFSKPTMYLLDENKKIIAKRFGYESLEELINLALENKISTLDLRVKE